MKLLAILLLCVGFASASYSEVEYGNLIGHGKVTLEKGDVFTLLANDLYRGAASLEVKIGDRTFYTAGKTICGPCVISINESGHFCSYQIIRSAAKSVQVVTYPLADK